MSDAAIVPDVPGPDPERLAARPAPAVRALHPVWQSIGRVHCYVLEDADGLTIIDALGDAAARPILDMLRTLGRRPDEIRTIILTHGHLTHVKGAHALKAVSGARVCAPAAERDVVEGRRPSNRTTWIPRRPFRVLPQQYLLNLSNVLWKFGIKPRFLTLPPVAVDHAITEDFERIGPVIAIRTPGHTPGSTSFYWPAMETLFAGDALVTWPRFEAGWRGLTEDHAQNLRSLHRLVDLCAARGWRVRTIATGHGDPLQFPDALAEIRRIAGPA